MTTYTVTAERGRRRWVLQCVEYPGAISEVTRLSQATETIAEAISFVAQVPVEEVHVTLNVILPEHVAKHLQIAEEERRASEQAKARAASERRTAARELREEGLSVREIGQVLEVSHQRAQQLIDA